jgi:hypothetical protein
MSFNGHGYGPVPPRLGAPMDTTHVIVNRAPDTTPTAPAAIPYTALLTIIAGAGDVAAYMRVVDGRQVLSALFDLLCGAEAERDMVIRATAICTMIGNFVGAYSRPDQELMVQNTYAVREWVVLHAHDDPAVSTSRELRELLARPDGFMLLVRNCILKAIPVMYHPLPEHRDVYTVMQYPVPAARSGGMVPNVQTTLTSAKYEDFVGYACRAPCGIASIIEAFIRLVLDGTVELTRDASGQRHVAWKGGNGDIPYPRVPIALYASSVAMPSIDAYISLVQEFEGLYTAVTNPANRAMAQATRLGEVMKRLRSRLQPYIDSVMVSVSARRKQGAVHTVAAAAAGAAAAAAEAAEAAAARERLRGYAGVSALARSAAYSGVASMGSDDPVLDHRRLVDALQHGNVVDAGLNEAVRRRYPTN